MGENSSPRRFNGRQRVALYLAQGGRCAICGTQLEKGWHGDHVMPWIKDGITDVVNGQALCPSCNLKKGDKIVESKHEFREWQLQAWEQYVRDDKSDWLLCATPGAGKTRWACTVARRLLDRGTIQRVVIVAPTQTIRDQWGESSILHLEAVQNEHGGLENPKDFEGVVVTYAQVASQPDLQRMGCSRAKTLVIFDEIHHAGFPNISWGDKAKDAFELSSLRIALTGTPWRRPGSGRIPFVGYDDDGKVRVDFKYEYGEAVAAGVCRRMEFRAYNGESKYVHLDSCAQNTVVYTLEDEDDTSTVLRDLLRPDGEWLQSMLKEAHTALLDIRQGNSDEDAIPDAKGLVLADSQGDAGKIGKLLTAMTGERAEVIVSEDPGANKKLDDFKNGKGMWAVAVNKVSEGVDIPALYVGVYATRKKTPLIFRQIVGRFVRRRVDKNGNPRAEEERSAILFMPAVPSLKTLASEIEGELRHQLDAEIEKYERELEQEELVFEAMTPAQESSMLLIGTSAAELSSVIVSQHEYLKAEIALAENYRQQFNFKDDAVKIAALLRALGVTSLPVQSTPQPSVVEEKTPKHKVKQALLKKVDRLSKQKALSLGVDFKEFNANLAKRFGPRRELTIDTLKQQLTFLEQMQTPNREVHSYTEREFLSDWDNLSYTEDEE